MKLRPPAERDVALGRFRALITRYQATLDLMSPQAFATLDRHIEQGLAYVAVLMQLSPAPTRVLDLGSGVGLPGIVIAAAVDELPIELVERRRKRATFLRMAAAAVAESVGTDVQVREDDVRAVDGPTVDVVVAQAVADFATVHGLTAHRHGPTVTLLARKGPTWRDELAALDAATGSAAEVVVARPLDRGGTLVAVRTRGGR